MTGRPRRKAAPVTTRKMPDKKPPAAPPEPPTRIGIEEAVQQMTPEFIACRDYGHSWQPFTVNWNPTDRYYQQQLRCGRCLTLRTRYLGPHGERGGGRYEYADGYVISGLGFLSTADRDRIRLASMLNLVNGSAAQ